MMRSLLVLVAVVAVAGCAVTDNYYSCDDSGARSTTPCTPEPDVCAGQCVPLTPVGWSDPVLLWTGQQADAPACPDAAPVLTYEGTAELGFVPDPACPKCSCETPEVTCELPATWTAASGVCPGNGAGVTHTSFDAPMSWDGSCTAENFVTVNKPCPGGPCVQSLSIEAPVAAAKACTPKTEEPSGLHDASQPWGLFARACLGRAYPPCTGAAELCVPEPPADGQFTTCVFQKGDLACPETYPDKQVFYDGVDDSRGCTECACGEPQGASCTVATSVYKDNACSALIFSVTIGTGFPLCDDVMPGSSLGSKTAVVTDLQAGSCAPSGGELTGTIEPAGPTTFCCLKEAPPVP